MAGGEGHIFPQMKGLQHCKTKCCVLSVYLLKYRMFMSPFVQMCKQLSFHAEKNLLGSAKNAVIFMYVCEISTKQPVNMLLGSQHPLSI